MLVAALVSIPVGASAQVTIGPVIGYDPDAEIGIGGQVGLPLSSLGEGQFGFLGDVLVFFPDGFDYLEINGNLTYDIPLENSSVVPFILGGINYARISVEVLGVSGSSSDVGLNLGGGVDFDLGSFRPTAGVRAELGGGEAVVFFFALPFQTGGS